MKEVDFMKDLHKSTRDYLADKDKEFQKQKQQN